MLAVYKAQNNIPVPPEEALKSLTLRFTSKTPPKVNKCVMQIWLRQKEAARFVLKSKNKVFTFIEFDVYLKKLLRTKFWKPSPWIQSGLRRAVKYPSENSRLRVWCFFRFSTVTIFQNYLFFMLV